MLTIAQALCDELLAHCQNQYPKEACGLLAGANGITQQLYAMTNVEESPISYAMDPREQLRAEKRMRQEGQRLVGIYHSHTASAAYPSSVDVSLAISPDVSYVLVSLRDRRHPEIKSYRIDGTKVQPEALIVGGAA